MSQKDKVKALVGGGLNAYHTKVNNQIERIEKENVRQNHMINVLNTELVKDYLTKVEEGSVISLDHSKEGMVFIDGLEGNTLVNYCTDGSKELILNGDIDTEGTFVTTTEGVDGGMVDVICEGNTLVNLSPWSFPYNTWAGTGVSYWRHLNYSKLNLVSGRTYTIIIRAAITNQKQVTLGHANSLSPTQIIVKAADFNKPMTFIANGVEDKNFTLLIEKTGNYEWTAAELDTVSMILLEGDWTDKEIPPYFEGMKSVGEGLDKFEILCRNSLNEIRGLGTIGDLLAKPDGSITTGGSADNYYSSDDFEEILPNTTYYFWNSKDGVINNNSQFIYFYDENKRLISSRLTSCTTFTSYSNARYFKMMVHRGTPYATDIKFMVTRTNSKPTIIDSKTKLNKKEILLNEPLRGLPNGVKDRFVKMGGKWYVERNCGEVVLDGSEPWVYYMNKASAYEYYIPSGVKISQVKENSTIVSDKTVSYTDKITPLANRIFPCVISGASLWKLFMQSPLSTLDEFKQWLSQNPITTIYELETPTYEPLEIEPTLNVYLDTAHISNNSIIPCNMKVKNTGYNTIIKPNTQYTVALDTNKSGTIGLNLGGGKVTTTNNVALITTPSTLTDDSLRFYGKSIKGKNVRLLEGNKTNWIPPMFEGMSSCFEDKENVVELKMVNGNLFDKKHLLDIQNWSEISGKPYRFISIALEPNTTYKIVTKNININSSNPMFFGIFDQAGWYSPNKCELIWNTMTNKNATFTTKNQSIYYWNVYFNNGFTQENLTELFEESLIDVQFEKVITNDYKEHQSNKIQYLLQEPLRKWDRFVFVDGKIMVERGSGTLSLPQNYSITVHRGSNEYYNTNSCGCYINTNIGSLYEVTNGTNEILCERFGYKSGIWAKDHLNEGICFISNKDDNRIAMRINNALTNIVNSDSASDCQTKILNYLKNNPFDIVYKLKEPTYEEIPTELQDIILECYENGTLFIDTIIPPTVTTRYSGETPIVSKLKKSKPFVEFNTQDINENIVPYLCDMDYRVVLLQLQMGQEIAGYKSLGNIFQMLKRDIESKRYSCNEYRSRIEAYLEAGKLTEEEFIQLGEMLND